MKHLIAILTLGMLVTTTSAASSSPPEFVFKMAAPGCQSEAVMKDIIALMADGDERAWSRELTMRILNGDCVHFEKGESAYFKAVHLFAGTTQVRKKGNPRTYWVPSHTGSARP